MAEQAASSMLGSKFGSSLELLLGRMASLLENEASLIRGVHKEVNEISLELETIQAFLKDADRKESGEAARIWIKEVKQITYDVEDIIDEYIFHMTKHKREGFKGHLRCIICSPKIMYCRRRIAARLEEIKTKVLFVSERARRYGLPRVDGGSNTNNSSDRWRHSRESSIFSSDDDVVGIDNNRELLIGWLTDAELCLILNWVVGMGGLGKTTLVAKVYKTPQVKMHFDCYAWVTVSQSYAIDNLLRSIIIDLFQSKEDDLPNNISALEYRQLVEILIPYLQQKRYVIIFDDVWDIDVWNLLKVAFPDHGCGSRIVITTRRKDIANICSIDFRSRVFDLEPLQFNESWGLFCKKAFWDNPCRECPLELEASARAIVDKCEGLPLAIVAIGGLMSLKERTQLAWKVVEDSLSWELNNNPTLQRMKSILLLSFYDLPCHLKSCFLHMSIFPQDYEIRRRRLIRIWIAEGFVSARRGMTLEEVGDAYFKELVCRSMLRLNEGFRWKRSYQVHDLMRDLALSIAQEEDFCYVHDTKEATQNKKPLRLSIYSGNENIQTSLSHLRSFMLFAPKVNSPSSLNKIFTSFKLLRVLNLQESSIEIVPNEVAELFNLRYLSLRDTNVRRLPKSIGRLQNLQTLDVAGSQVKVLPKGVEKLKNLRHLYMFYLSNVTGHNKGVQAPLGICKFEHLQSLKCIEANKGIIKQIGNLSQLRRLAISNVRKEEGLELCASIQNMKHLLKLIIVASREDYTLDLDALSSPPTYLQKIHFYGCMEKLPIWISSLANLTNLYLIMSLLKEDPLPLVQDLPNLMYLYLEMAYDGRDLHFCAGCFVRLKSIVFESFPHLEQIVVEQGSMPCIQQIAITSCPKLQRVPEGIEYLSHLQTLSLREMSDNFLATFHEHDKTRIQHIPYVRHFYLDHEGKWLFLNLK